MAGVQAVLQRVDAVQRSWKPAAFAVAVAKKFGDDRGGALAGLLAYYGFLSIFPLLLVLTTILGFVGNRAVSDSVIGTTLAQFPVLGQQIGRNVAHPISGSGLGLAIGLLVLLYGALGSTQAAQHAMAQVWNVPAVARPGFAARLGRGLALFAALGTGMALSALLSSVTTVAGQSFAGRAAGTISLLIVNIGLYVVAFRLLTPAGVPTRRLWPGAVLGAFGYTVLLTVGTALVQHQLRNAEAVYGQFAFVLGLLAWLALVAQLSLYAAEVNVVLARGLWPRGITAPMTDADRRVLRALVEQEERTPEQQIAVAFTPDTGSPADIAPAGRHD
jgi:YihY family inner membrane protein